MITLNKKDFYDSYREAFGTLSRDQVKGIDFLLDKYDEYSHSLSLDQFAYILATVKHETANTFSPIGERGTRKYFNRYDSVLANTESHRTRAKRHGNTKKGDGYRYRGRGFVQLTWKNNYQAASRIAHVDLVANPELALNPEIAWYVMLDGMLNGIFTGVCLEDCIPTDGDCDFSGARRIINGTDKADHIARLAVNFQECLINSVEILEAPHTENIKMSETKPAVPAKKPIKSKTVRFNLGAVSLITIFNVVSQFVPELEGMISPGAYQSVIAAMGIVGLFLRFKTTESISSK